jgi:hypothetical protein
MSKYYTNSLHIIKEHNLEGCSFIKSIDHFIPDSKFTINNEQILKGKKKNTKEDWDDWIDLGKKQ